MQHHKRIRPTATVRLPASMRVRDAITLMNAGFVESVALLSESGDVQGVLTSEDIGVALAADSDTVLRSSCESFLARHRDAA